MCERAYLFCQNGVQKDEINMQLVKLQIECLHWYLIFSFVSTVIASNLLLVDEIMRAGMSSLKG